MSESAHYGNPALEAHAAIAGSVLPFAARKDEILRMLKSSPAADTSQALALGELERQNDARNRIFGIPLVPNIVDPLEKFGESLHLVFPNAANTTELAETPE